VPCVNWTDGSEIEKALRDETERSGKGSDIPIKKCTSLEEAVKVAYRFASIGT